MRFFTVFIFFIFSHLLQAQCLEVMMAFTEKTKQFPISKVVEIEGTPYGLKAAYFAQHTVGEAVDLNLNKKTVFDLKGRAVDLELTKVNGQLALIMLFQRKEAESGVRVYNLETKTFINREIPFKETLTNLQAFPARQGLNLAAAFSYETHRAYVFDLFSGAASAVKLKNEIIPGWTRARPDKMSLNVISKSSLGSPEIRELDFQIFRNEDQIQFFIEGENEPLGIASTSLLDLPKTRHP